MGTVTSKENYLLYLIDQIKRTNLLKEDFMKKEFLSLDNNLIIKKLYYASDDGFIIKDRTKSKYFILTKIRTSRFELSKITNTLEKLELLNSDKFFNVYHFLIRNAHDNNGKLIYILFEGGNNPMKQLDMKKNDLTYKEKLLFFINILFNMKILEINKIQLGNLEPENIFYSNQRITNSKKIDFKLFGYKDIINNIYSEKNYFAPQILENKTNTKSNILSLCCILYELLFNDKLFPNKNDILNLSNIFIIKELKNISQNISKSVNIAQIYDENLLNFFNKIISPLNKKLILDEVLHEKFVINILKENNYFYELIEENLIEIGLDNLEDNASMKSN